MHNLTCFIFQLDSINDIINIINYLLISPISIHINILYINNFIINPQILEEHDYTTLFLLIYTQRYSVKVFTTGFALKMKELKIPHSNSL